MYGSIAFRISNWKLALAALAGILFLSSLGFWQLHRAQEKKILLASFAHRTAQQPLASDAMNSGQDLRYYQATVQGKFDNQHSYLLDNKILNGVVGYEIYTPFQADGLRQSILVDRGFIPLTGSRNNIPAIREINGQVKIIGMLNLPPTYVALGSINADEKSTWPKRVEYMDLTLLGGNNKFFPYILMIDPKDPSAYTIEWQAIVTIPPERHIAYAVQWFALAVTLLILFLVTNRKHLH